MSAGIGEGFWSVGFPSGKCRLHTKESRVICPTVLNFSILHAFTQSCDSLHFTQSFTLCFIFNVGSFLSRLKSAQGFGNLKKTMLLHSSFFCATFTSTPTTVFIPRHCKSVNNNVNRPLAAGAYFIKNG